MPRKSQTRQQARYQPFPTQVYSYIPSRVWSDKRSHVGVKPGNKHALHQRDIPRVFVRVLRPGNSILLPRHCRPRHPATLPTVAVAGAIAGFGGCRVSTRRSAAWHHRTREADLGELLSELLAKVVQPLQGGMRQKVLPTPPAQFVVRTGAALSAVRKAGTREVWARGRVRVVSISDAGMIGTVPWRLRSACIT